MIVKRLLNITALCLCLSTLGQTNEIDSLHAVHRTANDDSEKALVLLRIGFLYYQTSADSLLKYTQLGKDLALKIGFEKGVANAYNNLGTLEYSRSNHDAALEHYKKFLKISERINDQKDIARALNNLAIIYHAMGEYAKSLKNYERSLEVKESVGDLKGQGGTYNNMGCLLYTSPSPRDLSTSRMPSSA